ncbi:MAG: SpoIIE family protein phosphatase [Clostridium sp.]
MNKNFSLKVDKVQIKRGILSTFFIFICTLLFQNARELIPSIVEIKVESVFPPVIGLYFGTSGAIACAAGNLLVNLLNGNNNWIFLIINFFLNFVYAYIPFKLWYTFNIKNKCEIPNLNDINGILRYMYIIFIDSLVITLISALSYSVALDKQLNLEYIIFDFLNNYNFQSIVGALILIIFSTTEIRPYIPKTKSNHMRNVHYEYILYIICVLVLSGIINNQIKTFINKWTVSIPLLFASYILLIFFISRPIVNKENKVEISKIRGVFSIKGKITIGLLSFVIIFICFLYIVGYISLKSHIGNEWYKQIYAIICISSYFIFVIAILALKYVENTITVPIQILFNVVRKFSKGDYEKNENNQELISQCKAIRTGDEIEELAMVFCKMMNDIQEYIKSIEESAIEKEKAEAELMAATKIQSSLIPNTFPAFPNRRDFEVFANMKPAKGVSGDFYDFYLLDEKLAFVIADVSGEGVPAALFMMTAKSLIKNSFISHSDIEEVVKNVNNELCENNEELMFVTAFLGIIDLKSGIMTYVNAGHTPPLLKHDFGTFEYINIKNNCILGIIPNAKFEKQEMKLKKNDILFVYTDGVTEAMDSSGNLYGMKRLKEVLNKENMKHVDVYGMIPMVRKDIDKFCKGEKQTDDITMFTFKYSKEK